MRNHANTPLLKGVRTPEAKFKVVRIVQRPAGHGDMSLSFAISRWLAAKPRLLAVRSM